mgnify:CR=1 FL=1
MKAIKYIFIFIVSLFFFGFLNKYVFNEWQEFKKISKKELIGKYEFKYKHILYDLDLKDESEYVLLKVDKNGKILKVKEGKWYLKKHNIIEFDLGYCNFLATSGKDICLSKTNIKKNIFERVIKLEALMDDIGHREYRRGAEGNEFFIKVTPEFIKTAI